MNHPKMEFIQDNFFPSSTIPGMQAQPPDKEAKALELYTAWKKAVLEEGLAERDAAGGPAHNYLTVTSSSASQYTSSHTSSKRRRTASVSANGDVGTDRSSIVSFDGDECPSSANARHADPRAFDGRTVKQRIRKRLNPLAKAKAALIRHLGSCLDCRTRNVSCPVEHHDIESLERRYLAKTQRRQQRPRSMNQQHSSFSLARRPHERSISKEQVTEMPQNNELFLAIGQHPHLHLPSPVPYDNHLDIESPGGPDPLAGISSNSVPFYQTTFTNDPIGQPLYSTYQDARRPHERSISTEQVTEMPQNNELFLAIGQNPHLHLPSPVSYDNHLDIESPGSPDPLAGISFNSVPFYQTSFTNDPIGQTLYSTYQDGAMLALGVFREGSFLCQHLGLCSERFQSREALELHFEQVHFHYTRINPACRIVCKSCKYMYIEEGMNERTCQECQRPAEFEMWVYGRFIRVPECSRHSSDGDDAFVYKPTSTSSYAASFDKFGFGGAASRNGDAGGDGNGFQGSPHTTDFNFQNLTLGDSEYRDNGPFFLGQNVYHHNSSQYPPWHGNNNFGYRAVTQFKHTVLHPHILPKTQILSILILLLAFSSLSIALTLLFTLTPTYEWIAATSQNTFQILQRAVPSISDIFGELQANIPVAAFLVAVGSFAMCSSVKWDGVFRRLRFANIPVLRSWVVGSFAMCSSVRRGGVFRRLRFKAGYRALRNLAPFEFYQQTVPESFLSGGKFS